MSAEKQDNSDLLSLIPEQGANDHIASLRYAQMIQRALMPNPSMLKGRLKDFFSAATWEALLMSELYA